MQIVKNRQWSLYKKGAAAQFKMAKLNDPIDNEKTLQGWHLFVDASKILPGTETQANRSYDWKNKITLHLGVPDLALFLNGIRMKFDPGPDKDKPKKYELYHDPGKGGPNEGKVAKAMSISRGTSYGYMLSFREKKGDVSNSFSLPITDEELVVLDILLRQALVLVTGFFDDGELLVSKQG